MADSKSRSFVVYAVAAAIAIIVLIVFFAMSPVRRARPTINGAPPETSANLTGGPVNGTGAAVVGNTTGDH